MGRRGISQLFEGCEMWGRLLLLAVLTTALTTVKIEGLRCWNCRNARSEEECRKSGRLETCQRGQRMSCWTEIRYHRGSGNAISKGCKQYQACANDQRQNFGSGPSSAQCKPGSANSVCRCCCQRNRCSLTNFWCPGAKSECKPLPAPRDGSKQCKYRQREGEIGTVCKFSCNEGFLMKGKAQSVCGRPSGSKPKFTSAPPECERLPTEARKPDAVSDCSGPPEASPGGGRSCLHNAAGQVCSYSCAEGESMVGNGVVTCTRKSGWNGTTPECIPDCPWLPENPTNGIRYCDGHGEVGTACEFLCDFGYEMIGSGLTKCVLTGGIPSWSPRPPVCENPEIVPK